jgi:type II secretory pathway predicted ATPase ExeA
MAVYETFYSCRQEPFSLSPDPNFLYAAQPHREALAQLRYLVQERKGFAVLTGEVGTGKTMLLRSLIESVGQNVQTSYVFNPPRTIAGLYDAIGYELGIILDGVANPAAVLNRHLLSTYERGGTVVMIFDEAQSLSVELLEEIRLLTNIETSSTKLAQVILAGQPEFDTMIDSTELRALRQRLVFRFSLMPLSLTDTERYIAARLEAAGAQHSPFTAPACAAVHRYSSGVPRLINVICDNALLGGFATDSVTIDEELVVAAAADLRLISAPRRVYQPPTAPVLTNLNHPRRGSRPAPEEGLTAGNHTRRVLQRVADLGPTDANLAHRVYEPVPEPSVISVSQVPRSLEPAREPSSASSNHARPAYELKPEHSIMSADQLQRAYQPVPHPTITRVTPVIGPPNSTRRLVYSFILATAILVLVLAVIVIATQGNGDGSDWATTQIQDMFKDTLHWLGASARFTTNPEAFRRCFRA